MDTFLFFLYAIGYIFLFIWTILLAKRNRWLVSANVLILVILALLYENAVVTLGRYVGVGTILENLNGIRYWLHALFTPFLVLFALNTLQRAGVSWSKNRLVQWIVSLLIVGLMGFEILTNVLGLELKSKWKYGVLSYENVQESGLPVMVMIVTALLLIASIIIWKKAHWPWFFVGTTLMIVGSFLTFLKSGAIINGFELLLITSLVWTKRYQDQEVMTPSRG